MSEIKNLIQIRLSLAGLKTENPLLETQFQPVPTATRGIQTS